MALSNNNDVYKHSHKFRIVFYTAFMLVLWMPVALQAQSIEVPEQTKTQDAYLVSGIEVDITADNAVEARAQAFDVAQVKAYEVLAKRLLSSDQLKEFQTPDVNTISSYVRDYEVTNEKLSTVRYNGVYKIRFSKRIFADIQDTSSEKPVQIGDTLVVPFYQRAGRSFLWQANPFLNAWVKARENDAAGRFIVPVGDMDDITQVRDDQALSYDPSRMNAMRLRYQVRQIALMIAEPQLQPDGSRFIELSLYNAQPYGPELAKRLSVRAFSGESEEQLYNRVVSEAIKMASPQQPNIGSPAEFGQEHAGTNTFENSAEIMTGPESNINVQTSFSSVREWLTVKKMLEASPTITRVSVQSMSPRSAVLNIAFQSGETGLGVALQQSGFSLVPSSQGKIMQLIRGRGMSSAPTISPYVQPSHF